MIYLSGKVVDGVPAMITPAMGHQPRGTWAADTGCFANPEAHDDEVYLRFLDARPRETCLFATAPDRFGDGIATLAVARPMLPRIRELGFPAALVAQAGMTPELVPWEDVDVLFVGGPDAWQHSEALLVLVREAKRLGKRIHVGRVNGFRRYRWAKAIGAESADGTFLAFGPDENLRRLARWQQRLDSEPILPIGA
jgi:hypothetical protein